ncbi:TonB-dependent receptor plug domain-containing protein [Sulfuricurvum sp.]|uniref:TonB-dependent receptor plug domain-containing protein n=1 Tax=Sulfuricurvum sp. TaxID=2025608 RepID=UPI002D49F1BD|nr:TonB-dependent receptor [Sulfuricurvum sp.]HZF71262.1 TonB-dependent receptor [Sulfuricurvum sp.]
MKQLLSLIASVALLSANEYKIDLMDDVFGLDLYDLQKLQVSSASKSVQSLNFTPAKMIVVSKEQIEDRGYRGLDELLNDLPGFQIMRYADSGILNQIGIRGIMGTNYFKVLQDGIEIDQTDGEVLSHAMQYPLFGIERVEVLYGPASVVYGADAMSGVINLISSKAPNDELSVAGGKKGYKYLYGVKSLPLFDGRLTLKAHYHNDQDADLEKAYPQDFLREDVKLGSTIIQSAQNREFDYQPTITKSVGARYEKGGFDTGVNYRYSSESTLIAMNGGNSKTNLYDNNANLNTALFGYYGRYKGTFLEDVQSTTTLSYDSTELLEGSYFNNKYTSYVPGYKYSYSQRYAAEETLNKKFDNHNIIFGMSYESFKSTPMTIDLATPSISGPVYFTGSDIVAPIYHIKWNNEALYLQDQIALNDNVQLSLAGRYDHSSSYGSTFNPRFALIYSTDTVTQKLIYAQAYLAPSNYQKYKIYGTALKPNTLGDGNTYQTDRYRVANPDLKPERSKNYEYDLDLILSQNDQISFSTYYTTVKDIISNEETLPDQIYFIPDTTIIQAVGAANSIGATIYGGDISYQGHSYFAGYDVSYWANYSYVDGKIDYLYDYDLPYQSKHVFKSGGTLRYQNWRFSPSCMWVSPIEAAPYDNGKFASVKGHFVTNVFASYAFDQNKKISFRVDNLFDEHYYGVRYNSSSKYKSPQDTQMFSIAFTMSI